MDNHFFCSQIDFGSPEFDLAIKLRHKVLRAPLNLEFDPSDIAQEFDSFHMACFQSESLELLGVLTLKHISNSTLKMRQVAVDTDIQSNGIGRFLVLESENFAKMKGYKKIELHARDTAIPFYKKLKYLSKGDIFKEVGIDHLFMYKNI